MNRKTTNYLFFRLVLLLLIGCLSFISTHTVTVKWDQVIKKSKTLPTLAIVVNPLLTRTSTIHKKVFDELESLNASHVRYVFWMSYPRLSVAELEAPDNGSTYWNFTLIDPIVEDFMDAQKGRKVVVDFSTIPEWLFETQEKVAYPEDPDQIMWDYQRGTELVDPSMKQLADYYERLFSWYTKGGFVDENGRQHRSGHNYTFDYWEVFNDINYEHNMSAKQYTDRYDAIVSAVKKVAPNTKFVGLSLSLYSDCMAYFPYFLNHSNHKHDVPLDAISYHFYANSSLNDTIEVMQNEMFRQTNDFLRTVEEIEVIRKSLSPNTETMINELGTLHEDIVHHKEGPIPDEYWNLSAAIYACMYSMLSFIGIEYVYESALIQFPTQFPSTSMVDWNTGALNARGMALKLLIDNCGPGDELVNTTISGTDAIHGMAFITTSGHKKLLLLNKRIEKIRVNLPEGAKKTNYIDVKTGDKIETNALTNNTIDLDGFAVHVIEFC